MRAPSVSRPGSPRRSPPPTFSAGCARPSNVTTSDAPQRKGCEGRARNGENGPVSYPDLPAVPAVPSHRLDFLTSRQILAQRSEERRVGNECFSPFSSRWSQSHENNKHNQLLVIYYT